MMKRKRTDKDSSISPASYKDPSGFIYYKKGILYRQINFAYKENFDLLIHSGLCKKLQKDGLLVSHQEADLKLAHDKKAYKIIKPELIPFISYPYGWSFSMLKDAALLTLSIQKIALEHGMSLKDASAFNVQFLNGKPILIDTLSFEKYEEGLPWVAYRQFCLHFLSPLALMAYKDIRLNQLMKIYLDGIPLDLVSSLLPKKTYLNFSLLSHIHLHAKSQSCFTSRQVNIKRIKIRISKLQLAALVDNLSSTIANLKLKKTKTEWEDYYSFTNYSKQAFADKTRIVKKLVKMLKPKTVWDLGANDGHFSRIASGEGAITIAFDKDPIAVEKNYLKVKETNEKNILPLIVDLTNPPSDYGWSNEERIALIKRGPVDLIMALALIHHLAIGSNLPLPKISSFLAKICRYLMIEFIPKKDSQVKKLLASREDIFGNYNEENFEKVFEKYFILISKTKIRDSMRTIYLYKRK